MALLVQVANVEIDQEAQALRTGVPTVRYRGSESNYKPRRSRRIPPRSVVTLLQIREHPKPLRSPPQHARQHEKRGQLIERSGIRELGAHAAMCNTGLLSPG